MKKRVLSMLLAFILCFSTLPMTAFAQEADAVTEQEEQQEAAPAAEPEEQQVAVPAAEQKEAEAAAAPGIIMPARRIPRQTMRRRQQCRRYRHSSTLCRRR